MNTLRAYPIRAGQNMDPLVFAGFVQGYHACLDTLMALASTTKPQTIEATFGAEIN